MHYTSSIARALVACQSKKGRTHCASLIKVYRTSNAFYSPPSIDLWSLAKAKRGGPIALLLSRRTAPAMHFTPLHCSTFGRLLKQEGEDLLRFSYQGVLHPQCILLPSIARALVACQSKKGRTPVALLLSRRIAPAMHFTPLHKGRGEPR